MYAIKSCLRKCVAMTLCAVVVLTQPAFAAAELVSLNILSDQGSSAQRHFAAQSGFQLLFEQPGLGLEPINARTVTGPSDLTSDTPRNDRLTLGATWIDMAFGVLFVALVFVLSLVLRDLRKQGARPRAQSLQAITLRRAWNMEKVTFGWLYSFLLVGAAADLCLAHKLLAVQPGLVFTITVAAFALFVYAHGGNRLYKNWLEARAERRELERLEKERQAASLEKREAKNAKRR
jgi:hypothetical protein